MTDPLGNLRALFRDPPGHVVAVEEHTGTSALTTSCLYDPLGQLLTVTDALPHQTALQYDWLGRRTSLSNPDAGLVTFVYDAAGKLTHQQVHTVRSASGGSESEAYPPPSNHDWSYQYDPAHPHQARRSGTRCSSTT